MMRERRGIKQCFPNFASNENHLGFETEQTKHDVWLPPPDVVISLVWGETWLHEFLKALQVILLGSQVWKSLAMEVKSLARLLPM